jgi:hypothetical protein
MVKVRRADFDDAKDLTDVIAKTGGLAIYKATFGAYNLSSLIEHSYLSLLTTRPVQSEENVEEDQIVSFIALNDGVGIINDLDGFNKVVRALHHYIPATVITSVLCSSTLMKCLIFLLYFHLLGK